MFVGTRTAQFPHTGGEHSEHLIHLDLNPVQLLSKLLFHKLHARQLVHLAYESVADQRSIALHCVGRQNVASE